MIIKPFKELEDFARQEYARKIASLPKPKVVNVDALVAFLQDRATEVGGVGLRAPPLTFRDGVRLYVILTTLAELRTARAASSTLMQPLRIAAKVFHSLFIPIKRRQRWLWRWVAFPILDIENTEKLAQWLLHVPDDGAFVLSDKPGRIDWMDELSGFAREYPAWLDADGVPKYWATYVYGTRHMARARHREDLRQAVAVRAAASDAKGFEKFDRDWRSAAGWS